jgi:hypothetical protein
MAQIVGERHIELISDRSAVWCAADTERLNRAIGLCRREGLGLRCSRLTRPPRCGLGRLATD